MKKYSLSVEDRKVFGKKVKRLRKQGVLPGNIYGKGLKSQAIQMATKEFEHVFHEAGHSGVVDLKLGNETIPTLVHEVTNDHIDGFPLHVDFYKVNLKEKVKATVPVVVTGEPVAVTEKLGLLLQNLNEVEVEALPTDLPENVEVDVTHLAQVSDMVKVSDLKVPADVTVVADPETEVARIAELVSKEAEEQAAAEAAEAEAASAEGTEAPAEGETAGEESGETQAEAPKEETKE
ncbi:MAG TPA: 50S ribosomal protein L25 [Patescibacteria group bacterium]|nr:50S ribosomal protein L25 [Patescibacteria group bacterium]